MVEEPVGKPLPIVLFMRRSRLLWIRHVRPPLGELSSASHHHPGLYRRSGLSGLVEASGPEVWTLVKKWAEEPTTGPAANPSCKASSSEDGSRSIDVDRRFQTPSDRWYPSSAED